ncbi:hypothetical protein [Amnibacterium setariae]|uniref:Uncharacterized protein n=1 Tax=Amnibacterium setariae TaxID=2306585 RepID=A0A3A1TVK5_9MICO|nr:hypothetical protein [Amnibacterium setariae]RIX27551.1 hypothetical protein D1781_08205 [Amnibacterium setariae]
MPDLPPRAERPPWIDRRGWLELAVGFPLVTAPFALLLIDLMRSIGDERGYTARTVLVAVAIGAGIALALMLLTLWTWRRGPGRPAQRLGRHAWREERLPSVEPDRTLALRDLERRRRVLSTGLSPVLIGGLWLFVGVVQLATSDSVLHTVAWVLLSGAFLGQAVSGLLDRRRLPQLDALLEEGALEPRV